MQVVSTVGWFKLQTIDYGWEMPPELELGRSYTWIGGLEIVKRDKTAMNPQIGQSLDG